MSKPICTCGHTFFDEWEEVQHLLHGRHNYRSSTPLERAALASLLGGAPSVTTAPKRESGRSPYSGARTTASEHGFLPRSPRTVQ